LKKKKKSWLIQVYEEEEKAAQLNVYIHLLNFSALFVGQMMLSIKQKKK
jgi:predicted LPLAT superfamily acyltransferase